LAVINTTIKLFMLIKLQLVQSQSDYKTIILWLNYWILSTTMPVCFSYVQVK